jgi:hypothetical protein
MRTRVIRLTLATVVAVLSVLALGATNATANSATAMPAGMAETLKASPGSVRTGQNTVLLPTGLLVGFPDGQVGVQAARQCPQGFTCLWVDVNFEGVMVGIRERTEVWLRDFWYLPGHGNVIWSPGVQPAPGWVNFDSKATSLYNNTFATTAGFETWFSVPGYPLRYRPGAMVSYLGSFNDAIDKACICF